MGEIVVTGTPAEGLALLLAPLDDEPDPEGPGRHEGEAQIYAVAIRSGSSTDSSPLSHAPSMASPDE